MASPPLSVEFATALGGLTAEQKEAALQVDARIGQAVTTLRDGVAAERNTLKKVSDAVDTEAVTRRATNDVLSRVSGAVSQRTIFGSTAPLVAVNGTTTVLLSNTTYYSAVPFTSPGTAVRIEGIAAVPTTIPLKRGARAVDGVMTQLGSDFLLKVAAGPFDVTLKDFGGIPFEAGDYVGFHPGNPIALGHTPSGNPRTPFYSSAVGAGNVTTFTDLTIDTSTRFEIRITVDQPIAFDTRISKTESDAVASLEAIRSWLLGEGKFSPALLPPGNAFWFDADRRQAFTDLAGLEQVVADGAPVGAFRDKLRRGYNLAATTEAVRPTFRKSLSPELQFAAGQRLKFAKGDFLRAANKATIIGVVKPASPSGQQALAYFSSWPNAASARLLFGNIATNGGSRLGTIGRQTDVGTAVAAYSWRIAGELGGWDIVEVVADYAAGTLHFSANGRNTPGGSRKFPAMQPMEATDSLEALIGATGTGGSPFAGPVKELIGWTGEIDEELRRGILNGLIAKYKAVQEGDLSLYRPSDPMRTIWLWFNGNRVLQIAPKKFVVAGIAPDGDVMVGSYDFSGGGEPVINAVTLYNNLNRDDHSDPALEMLADGNIVAAFTRHGLGTGDYFVCRTTTPGDINTFGAPVNIKSQIMPNPAVDRFSYANLVRVGSRLYLFLRAEIINGEEWWVVSYSDDSALTFAQARRYAGPLRPYSKFVRLDPQHVGILFNDSHPGNGPNNNTYFIRLDALGNFKKMNGTVIATLNSLPLNFAQCDKVYDVSEGRGRSWVHDLIADPVTGHPVATFATFMGVGGGNLVYSDHRYHQARYDAGTDQFVREEMCAAGGPLIPGQPSYSGIAITSPYDIDEVWACRQVDAAGQISLDGVYHLFKGTRTGPGAWNFVQQTSGPEPYFRPVIPIGGAPGARWLFMCGPLPPPAYTATYGPSYMLWACQVHYRSI